MLQEGLLVIWLHIGLVFFSSFIWNWSFFRIILFIQGYNLLLAYFCKVALPWLEKKIPHFVYRVKDVKQEHRIVEEELHQYFLQTNVLILLAYVLYDFGLVSVMTWKTHWIWILFIIFRDVVLCYISFEILEYSLHRLLHTPWFFENVHHIHHRARASQSLTGFYMHHMDVFLQIIIPTFLPVMIWATNLESLLVFFTLGYFFIHTGHSGYIMKYVFSGEYHYVHHQKPTQHYSAIESFLN